MARTVRSVPRPTAATLRQRAPRIASRSGSSRSIQSISPARRARRSTRGPSTCAVRRIASSRRSESRRKTRTSSPSACATDASAIVSSPAPVPCRSGSRRPDRQPRCPDLRASRARSGWALRASPLRRACRCCPARSGAGSPCAPRGRACRVARRGRRCAPRRCPARSAPCTRSRDRARRRARRPPRSPSAASARSLRAAHAHRERRAPRMASGAKTSDQRKPAPPPIARRLGARMTSSRVSVMRSERVSGGLGDAFGAGAGRDGRGSGDAHGARSPRRGTHRRSRWPSRRPPR